MDYRNDIQELRAIAFLLVFIYHIHSDVLPAGFIGVDIFFVISGYIITNSLFKTIEYKNRLLLFYSRRIKRLFPSSFICLMFYYYYHPSIKHSSSSESELFYDILSGLLCISNYRFYKITNSYFQKEKSSLLLNYWSLSLEEQFYFLYPLLYYYWRKNYIFVIIMVCSFYKCVRNTYRNNASAYYFLSNRAWELLFGCLNCNNVYTYNHLLKSESVIYFIILLSYSIEIYHFKFPGFISLLPTLFTSYIITQSNNTLYSSRLLHNMGNMTYILYLFHYPIIQNNKSNALIMVKLLYISYSIHKYIEIPIKNSKNIETILITSFLFFIVFIICITKSIRDNKIIIKENFTIANKYCKNNFVYSYYRTKLNEKTILLLGDSHLSHYLSVIETALTKYDVDNILYLISWTINIEKNYIAFSKIIKSMKKLLLCIISLYVDYAFVYTNKQKFEYSFLYLIKNILTISKGIIIFQDNPHRYRTNDTKCRKYLLPIVHNKRITYIDIFDKYCNGNSECIENIYSPKIFEDMHHLKRNFVCHSKFIFKIIDGTLGLYLDNFMLIKIIIPFC